MLALISTTNTVVNGVEVSAVTSRPQCSASALRLPDRLFLQPMRPNSKCASRDSKFNSTILEFGIQRMVFRLCVICFSEECPLHVVCQYNVCVLFMSHFISILFYCVSRVMNLYLYPNPSERLRSSFTQRAIREQSQRGMSLGVGNQPSRSLRSISRAYTPSVRLVIPPPCLT